VNGETPQPAPAPEQAQPAAPAQPAPAPEKAPLSTVHGFGKLLQPAGGLPAPVFILGLALVIAAGVSRKQRAEGPVEESETIEIPEPETAIETTAVTAEEAAVLVTAEAEPALEPVLWSWDELEKEFSDVDDPFVATEEPALIPLRYKHIR
jgi:hypothetical protein